MIQVESWLSSEDGYLELAKGYLGNDTDEINQVLHAMYNALQRPNGMIVPKDLPSLKSTAVLVASGPSLDESVKQLSELQDRPVIISCGSSIGTLLEIILSQILLFYWNSHGSFIMTLLD